MARDIRENSAVQYESHVRARGNLSRLGLGIFFRDIVKVTPVATRVVSLPPPPSSRQTGEYVFRTRRPVNDGRCHEEGGPFRYFVERIRRDECLKGRIRFLRQPPTEWRI